MYNRELGITHALIKGIGERCPERCPVRVQLRTRRKAFAEPRADIAQRPAFLAAARSRRD
jgi:hypothetical protein